MFCKKVFLKTLQKSQKGFLEKFHKIRRKAPVTEYFFNKVKALAVVFLKVFQMKISGLPHKFWAYSLYLQVSLDNKTIYSKTLALTFEW